MPQGNEEPRVRHLLKARTFCLLAFCLPMPALAGNLAELARRVCAQPFLEGRPADVSGLFPIAAWPQAEAEAIRIYAAPGSDWTVTVHDGTPGSCALGFTGEPAGPAQWDRFAAMLTAAGYTALPDCGLIGDGARIDAFRGPVGDPEGATVIASVSGAPDAVEDVLFLHLPTRAALLPCDG